MDKMIQIRGARVNNLKNVDLDIPINKMTIFTGPSGSGKSSLAFHGLFTESKRRFLNSFPTYLKFFSDRPAPVDIDSIKPVLPVFGLPQINPVVGTRSTVGDIMQLTELLQAHFFHYSKEICPIHGKEFVEESFSDYIKNFVQDSEEVYHLLINKEQFVEFFAKRPFPSRSIKSLRSKKINEFDNEHDLWEIVRFKEKHIGTLNSKIKEFLEFNVTLYLYCERDPKIKTLDYRRSQMICPVEDCSEKGHIDTTMMSFSPYNPIGACTNCGGFGETLEYDLDKLVDQNKSVNDDGVILLNYKRFTGQSDYLKAELKKKKISLTKPIKELDKKFWEVLYDGAGRYAGFSEIFSYLESKKYKMNVRIFIRNIQKSEKCSVCNGTRLSEGIENHKLSKAEDSSIQSFLILDLQSIYNHICSIESDLFYKTKESKKSLNKIKSILKVAIDLGLDHLSCLRKSKSLSAGEYQRLLLLKYLSYEGTGSLFVFDEPSLGLEDSQLKALVKGFRDLIKQGNTVLLVDHNKYLLKNSDYNVELGPGAGKDGGEIISAGETNPKSIVKSKFNLIPNKIVTKEKISVKGASIFDKKLKNVQVPLDSITLVQGRSGSGKTSLFVNILASELHYKTHGEYLKVPKGIAKEVACPRDFSQVIVIDSNLNRYTSRSTVGSLTGLFPVVRKHFLSTPMAKSMGLVDGNLSYNSDLGQCPKCEGKGHTIVEMQFLEDIILTCEDCKGKKLKPHYADLSDGEMTVHEAFTSPLNEILEKVKLTPKFQRVYKYLKLLNLDYLSLDRQINTLSGGERQRIYLLSKLLKDLSNSFIVFENISFGLSEKELLSQTSFLLDLNLKENTIVIIDQHPIFKEISNKIIDL